MSKGSKRDKAAKAKRSAAKRKHPRVTTGKRYRNPFAGDPQAIADVLGVLMFGVVGSGLMKAIGVSPVGLMLKACELKAQKEDAEAEVKELERMQGLE